jgi:hypothetical protein
VLIIGAGPTGLTPRLRTLIRRGVGQRGSSSGPRPRPRGSRRLHPKPHSLLDVLADLRRRLVDGGGCWPGARRSQKLRFHLGEERLFDLDQPPSTDLFAGRFPNPIGIPLVAAPRQALARAVGRSWGGAAREFGPRRWSRLSAARRTAATAVLAGGGTVAGAATWSAPMAGAAPWRQAAGIDFPGRLPGGPLASSPTSAPRPGTGRGVGPRLHVGPGPRRGGRRPPDPARRRVAGRPCPTHRRTWEPSAEGVFFFFVCRGPAAGRDRPPPRARTSGFNRPAVDVGVALQPAHGRALPVRPGASWPATPRHCAQPGPAGHGMNTGIQDAANLGLEARAGACRGRGGAVAETAYEAERAAGGPGDPGRTATRQFGAMYRAEAGWPARCWRRWVRCRLRPPPPDGPPATTSRPTATGPLTVDFRATRRLPGSGP